MPRTILEVTRDHDGRYLAANEAALDVLGYTLEELRAARPGALAGVDPAIQERAWPALTSGELEMPRWGEWFGRLGDRYAIEYLWFGPGPEPGTWLTRAALVSRRRIALDRPWVLGFILDQWREAERELAVLTPDDPARAEAEEDVAELRQIYQLERERLERQRGAVTVR